MTVFVALCVFFLLNSFDRFDRHKFLCCNLCLLSVWLLESMLMINRTMRTLVHRECKISHLHHFYLVIQKQNRIMANDMIFCTWSIVDNVTFENPDFKTSYDSEILVMRARNKSNNHRFFVASIFDHQSNCWDNITNLNLDSNISPLVQCKMKICLHPSSSLNTQN